MNTLIIGSSSDAFIESAAQELANSMSVIFHEPRDILKCRITLSSAEFLVNEIKIDAVVIFHDPYINNAGLDFNSDDQQFAETEWRSILSALKMVKNLVVINPLNAVQWFARPGWEYFYSITSDARSVWSDISVGSLPAKKWVPFCAYDEKSVIEISSSIFPVGWSTVGKIITKNIIFDHIIHEDGSQEILDIRTKLLLKECGLDLARLFYDQEGRLLFLTTKVTNLTTAQQGGLVKNLKSRLAGVSDTCS